MARRILVRNSTKIGDLDCGATYEDPSFVRMTRLYNSWWKNFTRKPDNYQVLGKSFFQYLSLF
ncbi:hypothetical protein EYY60_01315 [Flavobacterium zhairuonense]|uniref:hypothetical protein n=1 Tax=Flavobacterium zhairuonense TaxID=2493631 RepID=UPI0010434E85|nr:hypothetical protein [Flavobacterium zhairuonense]KAF2516377.1 hypothetical protein EYY60_01315 [Flavobacterium zhairuonense]